MLNKQQAKVQASATLKQYRESFAYSELSEPETVFQGQQVFNGVQMQVAWIDGHNASQANQKPQEDQPQVNDFLVCLRAAAKEHAGPRDKGGDVGTSYGAALYSWGAIIQAFEEGARWWEKFQAEGRQEEQVTNEESKE